MSAFFGLGTSGREVTTAMGFVRMTPASERKQSQQALIAILGKKFATLMTSFTVILAMLPAAMGFGAGHETNGPLSVAVIGGMLSSTLLTLVVVPTVYSSGGLSGDS